MSVKSYWCAHFSRLYLSNAEQLCGVAQAPMTEFVAQYCNDFFRLTLLNERVVNDDMFLPGKPIKVSVTVSTSLATVDDIKLFKRELKSPCQRFHRCLQLAFLERRKLVEERQDQYWIYGDCADLDPDGEEPKIIEEAVSGLLNDSKEPAQQRCTKGNHQGLFLQHIRYPKLQRLLIETELLLEYEGTIICYW